MFWIPREVEMFQFLKAAYNVSLVVCNVCNCDGGGRGVWGRRQCPQDDRTAAHNRALTVLCQHQHCHLAGVQYGYIIDMTKTYVFFSVADPDP
jgi:hypothetical protein